MVRAQGIYVSSDLPPRKWTGLSRHIFIGYAWEVQRSGIRLPPPGTARKRRPPESQ
jgi:hypothetical protein